jgi:hypothetical protein
MKPKRSASELQQQVFDLRTFYKLPLVMVLPDMMIASTLPKLCAADRTLSAVREFATSIVARS